MVEGQLRKRPSKSWGSEQLPFGGPYTFVFEVEDWGTVANAVAITHFLYSNPLESAPDVPLDGGGYIRTADGDATGQKGRFAFHLSQEGLTNGAIILGTLLDGIARAIYANMQVSK